MNGSNSKQPKGNGQGMESCKAGSTTKSVANSASSVASYQSSTYAPSVSSYSSVPSISGATIGTLPPVSVPAGDQIDVLRTLSRIYPDKKIFYPDGAFSAQECHALAVVEARYRGQRLSYIQADFERLTGRKVDLEVLRTKLAQGVEPYGSVATNWGGICYR
ncbi:hypothetical protein F4811DRAFT_534646 [Daldinia bambusicola]|nr:hypothetical protein F4811DRAFT_534646 [Daldinia bambusicola]